MHAHRTGVGGPFCAYLALHGMQAPPLVPCTAQVHLLALADADGTAATMENKTTTQTLAIILLNMLHLPMHNIRKECLLIARLATRLLAERCTFVTPDARGVSPNVFAALIRSHEPTTARSSEWRLTCTTQLQTCCNDTCCDGRLPGGGGAEDKNQQQRNQQDCLQDHLHRYTSLSVFPFSSFEFRLMGTLIVPSLR